MSERAAFISAILTDLADDTPRLVFADWLEENGEPERAEFIRCQIEAANLPPAVSETSAPMERATELLKQHSARWQKELGMSPLRVHVYERGFLTDVRLYASEFAARTATLLAREPAAVRLVLLNSTDSEGTPGTARWIDTLAADPNLAAVTRMGSQSGGMGELFARLLRSPHLKNLRRIDIFEDVIGLEGVRAIAESPSPFVLTHLDLNSALSGEDGEESSDGAEAVRLIATHPRFAALEFLGLPFNSLGNESAEALLTSTTLPRTLRAELEENNWAAEYEERLAERFTGGSDGG